MQKKSKFNVFTFMMLIILGLTFQPAISTYAACPDDIFSYWKLDEPTRRSGAPMWTLSRTTMGRGLSIPSPPQPPAESMGPRQFNGTDTEINVPADNSFDWQSDESFSIEFWVKIDGADCSWYE